jgi:uncharacterized protein (TIGR03086 family)
MVMESDDVFELGLDEFGKVACRLQPEDWDRPSPCEGWTALDVLGHLSTSVNMGTNVLQGFEPDWPEFDRPADLVDDEPWEFWLQTDARARWALDEEPDLELVMDTPMGKQTVRQRLAFPAIDVWVHAWDVGRAAGIAVEILPDAIELAHRVIDPLPVELVRGATGAFGPEVPAPPDATPTEAFIAWTGRRPR